MQWDQADNTSVHLQALNKLSSSQVEQRGWIREWKIAKSLYSYRILETSTATTASPCSHRITVTNECARQLAAIVHTIDSYENSVSWKIKVRDDTNKLFNVRASGGYNANTFHSKNRCRCRSNREAQKHVHYKYAFFPDSAKIGRPIWLIVA